MANALANRLVRPAFIIFATLVAVAAMLVATAQPASAHTRAEAVTNGCGSGYAIASDGVRNVNSSSGAKWGEVILAYNASNGRNCVVTNKTSGSPYHGTPTRIAAVLVVQGDTTYHRADDSASHWESISAYAADACVQYWGYIYSPSGSSAFGGRQSWGNCG
ncbi:hypothetical protein [Glycomyces sp. NPDC021274]|jgi:hypothetical protein|uniref:hypothetical protein n=1 Tax=Glycomyces sp. NPDC021274 TaxID=3155120 RepID=UPI0033F61856